MKPRVLVADDHSVVLEGLRSLVERAGCELAGVTLDGLSLIQSVTSLKPDLVILDITMPVVNGIEAARQIHALRPELPLIFLTMHADLAYVREAFRAGGSAYVLKQTSVSELGTAVNEVIAGRHYISPMVTTQTVAQLLATPSAGFGGELTKRQREVLQMVAEGKTAKEIAAILKISHKTVEFHKAMLMDVLGMRTTAELTRYALENRIVVGER